MALKIEIEPLGPGSARLLVARAGPAPESVLLAMQRNDGRYLGLAGQWQATPHWHPQFSAQVADDGLRLEVGPDLVDSLVDLGGSPLRVALRIDGDEDAGVLRMRGSLIGSPARAPGQVAPSGPASDQAEGGALGLDWPDLPLDEPGADADSKPVRPRVRWVWLGLAVVALGVTAAVIAWGLGLLDPAQPEPVAAVAEVAGEPTPDRVLGRGQPEQTAPEVAEQPEPPVPPATGLPLARDVIAGNPGLAAVFARAEQADQARDCTAAYALYSEAANGDAGLAARLARRYDPLTHSASPCIAEPDIPYAIVYFTDAAEQGDVAVQRRLGQLMVEREASGPTRDAGLRWLRQAAEAGDAEAKQILDGLDGRVDQVRGTASGVP